MLENINGGLVPVDYVEHRDNGPANYGKLFEVAWKGIEIISTLKGLKK